MPNVTEQVVEALRTRASNVGPKFEPWESNEYVLGEMMDEAVVDELDPHSVEMEEALLQIEQWRKAHA